MSLNNINYKEYPECMFAILAAFLPASEGNDLRRAAGKVVFKSTDKDGNTYRNGLLHSFDDVPALVNKNTREWYKNGILHREGDQPAIIIRDRQEWWVNGKPHREGNPALIDPESGAQEWWIDGELISQS
jgi:hypothetical protein